MIQIVDKCQITALTLILYKIYYIIIMKDHLYKYNKTCSWFKTAFKAYMHQA